MNGAPAPWYRQFWAWFVIAPPLAAVLAGVATVVIATHDDSIYRDTRHRIMELRSGKLQLIREGALQ